MSVKQVSSEQMQFKLVVESCKTWNYWKVQTKVTYAEKR